MTEDIKRRDSIEKLKKKAQKEIIDLSRFPQENPNPIFRLNNKLEIIYANSPGKSILEKLGLKGKKIPKNLIDSVKASIEKKNDSLMILEIKSVLRFMSSK